MNHLGIQDVVLSQWFAKVCDLGCFLFICRDFLGKGNGEPAYFLHNCLILELDWVSSGKFSVFGTV